MAGRLHPAHGGLSSIVDLVMGALSDAVPDRVMAVLQLHVQRHVGEVRRPVSASPMARWCPVVSARRRSPMSRQQYHVA
jgi:hypothetical protein